MVTSDDRMVDELKAAGWEPKTPMIWRAPNGCLYLGPAGAWRRMKGVQSVQDKQDIQNGRARIIRNAMKLRAEIDQIFTDCASWNDNSEDRKRGAEPIDVDPDGKLRRIADGIDKMLTAESARGMTGTV